MISKRINIDKLIQDAISGQDERARRIVSGRYGLGQLRRKTLAQLGGEYNLTRERVRQIQAASLKAIRREIKTHKEAVKLLKLLERYLKDAGHIRRADFIAHDLAIMLGEKEDDGSLFNKLQFLADVLEWPMVSGGNEDLYVTWYSKADSYDLAKKLIKELLDTTDHDFDKFVRSACERYKMSEPQVVNHLTVSRRFSVGPYGDLGADHWIHVNPKTVRDKIYLVLQKSDEPLHFNDIAILINNLSDKKRAAATVHNELIKDSRFNLVGRGTYSINA